MTDLGASWQRWTLPIAVSLLGIIPSANSVLADNPAHGQVHEINSKPAEPSSDRSMSVRAPSRKPLRKPGRSSNFIYEVLNNIRVQSEELCARYGNPDDCLEEVEVCLTMRDTEGSQARLCLNTVPVKSTGEEGNVQKSGVRRSSRQ